MASLQSSDDEFEDAADEFGSHFTVAVPTNHKRTASNASQVSTGHGGDTEGTHIDSNLTGCLMACLCESWI